MTLQDFLFRLLGITRTIQSWHTALLGLDAKRRERLATYAEEIAATFGRAAAALAGLDKSPNDRVARRDAVRELGRVSGYLDDLVAVLEQALDGRKVAGLKRRLGRLARPAPIGLGHGAAAPSRLEALLDAEGYFRALADGLRASCG